MSVFDKANWASWRTLKDLHNKKSIVCKSITNSQKKRLCLDTNNAELYKKQLSILKRVLSKDCPQNKDVDYCRKKGQVALNHVQQKLTRLANRSKQRRLKGLYRY